MKSTYFIWIFLFLFSFQCLGQKYLYPIRQNHKWGYISNDGELEIEPIYDAITNRPSQLYLSDKKNSKYEIVEKDGKLGLILALEKTLVIEPNYKKIRVLSNKYFAVESESLFQVIDSNGVLLIDSVYQDIKFVGENQRNGKKYFGVRNKKRWGIHEIFGELILPMKYDKIQVLPVDPTCFEVNKVIANPSGLFPDSISIWGILDDHNQEILPTKYQFIKACNDDFFAAKEIDSLWYVFDRTGNKKFKEPWLSVKPLNQHFLALRDSTIQTFLYSYENTFVNSFSKANFNFFPFDDDYIIYSNDKNIRYKGLLDKSAKIILKPIFYDINPYKKDVFQVSNETRLFGLWDLDKGLILDYKYDKILEFNENLAVVILNGSFGIINQNMEEIIPPIYRELRRDGQYIKAFNKDIATVFSLSDSNQIDEIQEFENVFSLYVEGGTDKWELLATTVIRKQAAAQLLDTFLVKFHHPVIAKSKWTWNLANTHNTAPTNRGIIKYNAYILTSYDSASNAASFLKKTPLKAIVDVEKPQISFLYALNKNANKALSKIVGSRSYGLSQAAIFNHNSGKMLTDFDFLGIRRTDFERGFPFAAAVNLKGKYQLVDTLGHLAKTDSIITATYIGDFFKGHAAFCIGGKLVKMTQQDHYSRRLDPINYFVKNFSIHGKSNFKAKNGHLEVDQEGNSIPKWGIMDSLGRVVIAPKYDFIKYQSNGQVIVVKNKNWGVIDLDEKEIIPLKYARVSKYYNRYRVNEKSTGPIYYNFKGWEIVGEDIEEKGIFSEGLCQIKKDNLWGYINSEGDIKIAISFDQCNPFSDGIATVKKDGQWLLIDTSGQVLHSVSGQQNLQKPGFDPSNIDEMGQFHYGKCWFKTKNRYGYVDNSGHIIIQPKYTQADDFREDNARVKQGSTVAIIQASGKLLFPFSRYKSIAPFDPYGNAVVYNQKRKKGMINPDGHLIVKLKYRSIGKFKSGLAPIYDGKNYGYIDPNGHIAIPLKYSFAQPFSEGLGAVRLKNTENWKFINTNNESVFEHLKIVWVTPFKDGFATIKLKSYKKSPKIIINRKGEIISKNLQKTVFVQHPIYGYRNLTDSIYSRYRRYYYGDANELNLFNSFYTEINPFIDDISMVRKGRQLGIINKMGMFIIPNKYYYLKIMENVILAGSPSFGIIDTDGKVIIPAKFDKIQLLSGNIYRMEKGEKVGYRDIDGDWIWKMAK